MGTQTSAKKKKQPVRRLSFGAGVLDTANADDTKADTSLTADSNLDGEQQPTPRQLPLPSGAAPIPTAAVTQPPIEQRGQSPILQYPPPPSPPVVPQPPPHLPPQDTNIHGRDHVQPIEAKQGPSDPGPGNQGVAGFATGSVAGAPNVPSQGVSNPDYSSTLVAPYFRSRAPAGDFYDDQPDQPIGESRPDYNEPTPPRRNPRPMTRFERKIIEEPADDVSESNGGDGVGVLSELEDFVRNREEPDEEEQDEEEQDEEERERTSGSDSEVKREPVVTRSVSRDETERKLRDAGMMPNMVILPRDSKMASEYPEESQGMNDPSKEIKFPTPVRPLSQNTPLDRQHVAQLAVGATTVAATALPLTYLYSETFRNSAPVQYFVQPLERAIARYMQPVGNNPSNLNQAAGQGGGRPLPTRDNFPAPDVKNSNANNDLGQPQVGVTPRQAQQTGPATHQQPVGVIQQEIKVAPPEVIDLDQDVKAAVHDVIDLDEAVFDTKNHGPADSPYQSQVLPNVLKAFRQIQSAIFREGGELKGVFLEQTRVDLQSILNFWRFPLAQRGNEENILRVLEHLQGITQSLNMEYVASLSGIGYAGTFFLVDFVNREVRAMLHPYPPGPEIKALPPPEPPIVMGDIRSEQEEPQVFSNEYKGPDPNAQGFDADLFDAADELKAQDQKVNPVPGQGQGQDPSIAGDQVEVEVPVYGPENRYGPENKADFSDRGAFDMPPQRGNPDQKYADGQGPDGTDQNNAPRAERKGAEGKEYKPLTPPVTETKDGFQQATNTQQLIDLQRRFDEKKISREDYERQRFELEEKLDMEYDKGEEERNPEEEDREEERPGQPRNPRRVIPPIDGRQDSAEREPDGSEGPGKRERVDTGAERMEQEQLKGIPGLPQNIELIESEPLLRPSFIEGGANIVAEMNKDPSRETVDRLIWQSFNNYSWEANEEADNPFYAINTIETGYRFRSPLFGEQYLAQQEQFAKSARKTRLEMEKQIPDYVKQRAQTLLQDRTIAYSGNAANYFLDMQVVKGQEQVDAEFHDTFIPAWATIPVSDPLELFTPQMGSQFDDQTLDKFKGFDSNYWEKENNIHQYIFYTDA